MKRWVLLAAVFLNGFAVSAEDWVLFHGASPVYNMAGDYQYDFHEAERRDILRAQGLTSGNAASAQRLNTAGYRLYARKSFAAAADLFRLAVRADASYYFPHWNLACVLALLAGQGRTVDPQEIVYHIQYAFLLDPATARRKLAADTDLDPVRSTAWFKEFQALVERPSLHGNEEDVSLNGKRVAGLATETRGPVSYGSIYRPSPDGTLAAFMARWNGQPEVFLLTSAGLLIRVTTGGTASMEITANGNIAWQPQGRGVALVGRSRRGEGAAILYFDLRTLAIREVLAAAEHQDDGIFEINALRFSAAHTIDFMGGGSLEYSFAGREYEVNLDGSGFHAVPGGRVEHGEDLRHMNGE